MNDQQIQEELTKLYQELNSSPLLNSEEENWVRDQERFINALRAKIQSLTTLI